MTKVVKLGIFIGMLSILLIGNIAIANEKDYALEETLRQIDNPNPQAMEAYTQLTGNPDEYLDRLYESLERLTQE